MISSSAALRKFEEYMAKIEKSEVFSETIESNSQHLLKKKPPLPQSNKDT